MAMPAFPTVEPRAAQPGQHQLSTLAGASDADLALAMMEGNLLAHRVAWQRFMPLVRGMVRRAFGREAETDDVIQEIFLCLFQRVHTLREPMALRAFVMAIASRTLHHQRRQRRSRYHVVLESSEQATEALVLSVDAATKHAFINFTDLVRRLRKRERVAFILRYVEGMDAAEVGDALGVSAPTARRSFLSAWRRINVWASRDPFLANYLRPDSNRASLSGELTAPTRPGSEHIPGE
jgi:RNA polymerase sigma-70 factor (ECF subfamily)